MASRKSDKRLATKIKLVKIPSYRHVWYNCSLIVYKIKTFHQISFLFSKPHIYDGAASNEMSRLFPPPAFLWRKTVSWGYRYSSKISDIKGSDRSTRTHLSDSKYKNHQTEKILGYVWFKIIFISRSKGKQNVEVPSVDHRI